jgi:hypothetical protein
MEEEVSWRARRGHREWKLDGPSTPILAVIPAAISPTATIALRIAIPHH